MTIYCTECGHPADVVGQPCPMCFWGLSKSRDEEDDVRRDLRLAKERIEVLEEQRARLIRLNAELADQVREAVQAADAAVDARDAYRAQRDELAAQIDGMGDVRDLRETIRGLKADLSHAEERAAGWRSDLLQAEKAHDERFEECRDLRAKLAKAESDLDGLKRMAHALIDENARIATEKREAMARIAELEANAGAVYDAGAYLTDENEELRLEVRRLTRLSLDLAAIVARG